MLSLLYFLCRKANRLFEKNAAPILHLAGVEVKIVKVQYHPLLVRSFGTGYFFLYFNILIICYLLLNYL